MQRFIWVVCLIVLAGTSEGFAQQVQQLEDVVYLKNGGVVRGTIIEEVVGKSLKIRTGYGNVFVYGMDEIVKITKEPVVRARGQIGVPKKNPWLAFGLSALVTGGGQFYNGQHSKGIALLGWSILGAGLMLGGLEDNYENRWGQMVDPDDDDGRLAFGFLVWLSSSLWSMIDAPISANSINRQSQGFSYRHLIELGGDRVVLGLDPVVSENLGTRLTLHF